MKDKVTLGVAVVITVAYLVFVWVLWDKVGEGEVAWGRRILLFTGVEAIAFAGVGWLFGKEVNRHAADSADAANQQAAEAKEALGDATGKGKALAEAVRAASSPGGALESVAQTGDPLTALADRLFPPGS